MSSAKNFYNLSYCEFVGVHVMVFNTRFVTIYYNHIILHYEATTKRCEPFFRMTFKYFVQKPQC